MADETMQRTESTLLRAYTPQACRNTSVDEAERTVEVVASSEAWDSYDTRLLSSGWELSRYSSNPVVLACHDTRSLNSVIGTAETRVQDDKLMAKIRFLPAGKSEQADLAFDLYRMGALRGVSVGFIPMEYKEEDMPCEGDSKRTRKGLTFTRQQLVEISAVPVPANPEALARAMRDCCGTNESKPMTDDTTDIPVTVEAELAPALAELLHVQSVDEAVREIAKRDLELDQARQAIRAAEDRAASAESKLREIDEKNTVEVVDALIASGRISENKRESALALARTSPQAFRDLYPPVSEAPKSYLLKRLVENEPAKRRASTVSPGENPIVKRAEELVRQGKVYEEAYSIAVSEYESNKGGV